MATYQFIKLDTSSDLYPKVVQLRQDLLRTPLGMTFSAEDLEIDQEEWIFALLNDDKPVACLQIRPLSDTLVKLRQMAVDTNYQKQGLGRLLIQKVEGYLKNNGIKNVELHARKNAKEFYLKLGYQILSDEFIEVGIPHYKMGKNLL
ncbi:MAG TPA: GNAT family N-acetyltransferase [Flavobacteriales bacterium]|jgi:predicted GNAT family N-acyltransferase|nr:GNAT family N-acetyltransferase [Flavobacteriales bacterium]